MKQYDTPLTQAFAELALSWIRDNHPTELADAAR